MQLKEETAKVPRCTSLEPICAYVGFCSDLSDSSYCLLNVASQSNESLCIRMVNYSIETIIYIYIFFIVRVL